MTWTPGRGQVKRPYFENHQVEAWAVRELDALSLLPATPGPIRIERFVERRFDIGGVVYDELPLGILGFTVFGPRGVQEVVVSRSLTDEETQVAERRVRTTLAHEAGHGLMHVGLFEGADGSLELFSDDSDVTHEKILCRDQPSGPGYHGRWWEFQANMMMAALLLPGELVLEAVSQLTVRAGLLGHNTLPRSSFEVAVPFLSELFDVNPVVAQYRLEGLYPLDDETQLTL